MPRFPGRIRSYQIISPPPGTSPPGMLPAPPAPWSRRWWAAL